MTNSFYVHFPLAERASLTPQADCLGKIFHKSFRWCELRGFSNRPQTSYSQGGGRLRSCTFQPLWISSDRKIPGDDPFLLGDESPRPFQIGV